MRAVDISRAFIYVYVLIYWLGEVGSIFAFN